MKPVWEGLHFKAYHESVEIAPGKVRTFEYVWRIDGTRSIVVNSTDEILLTREYRHELLTREYRHELEDYDWRLPGGKLDFIGEPVIEAASRELREETGITARNWCYLWATTPDATVRFRRHFLVASDISLGAQELSEGERISISWFSRTAVEQMALRGEIKEEISALSILRYINGTDSARA
jgi:ADP-ribose pyrophosphatase